MERKKNTDVIAITDYSAVGNAAVLHAASLARFFESTLTIVTNFSFEPLRQFRFANGDFHTVLQQAQSMVEVTVNEMPFQPEGLHAMAESANHIMYVIGVSRNSAAQFNPSRALQFIAPSRLPVMAVGEAPVRDPQWQNILLSVDVDLPAKEKALWAGYFNRYGKSNIHILHNEYQDSISKDKLSDLMDFINKLYENLEITPVPHIITPKAYNLDQYAVEHADDYQGAALVVMTTTHKTFIDRIFGTREKQLLANPQNLPVLFINERDDLFVLCA